MNYKIFFLFNLRHLFLLGRPKQNCSNMHKCQAIVLGNVCAHKCYIVSGTLKDWHQIRNVDQWHSACSENTNEELWALLNNIVHAYNLLSSRGSVYLNPLVEGLREVSQLWTACLLPTSEVLRI